jgi:hypothetical protein
VDGAAARMTPDLAFGKPSQLLDRLQTIRPRISVIDSQNGLNPLFKSVED